MRANIYSQMQTNCSMVKSFRYHRNAAISGNIIIDYSGSTAMQINHEFVLILILSQHAVYKNAIIYSFYCQNALTIDYGYKTDRQTDMQKQTSCGQSINQIGTQLTTVATTPSNCRSSAWSSGAVQL